MLAADRCANGLDLTKAGNGIRRNRTDASRHHDLDALRKPSIADERRNAIVCYRQPGFDPSGNGWPSLREEIGARKDQQKTENALRRYHERLLPGLIGQNSDDFSAAGLAPAR